MKNKFTVVLTWFGASDPWQFCDACHFCSSSGIARTRMKEYKALLLDSTRCRSIKCQSSDSELDPRDLSEISIFFLANMRRLHHQYCFKHFDRRHLQLSWEYKVAIEKMRIRTDFIFVSASCGENKNWQCYTFFVGTVREKFKLPFVGAFWESSQPEKT